MRIANSTPPHLPLIFFFNPKSLSWPDLTSNSNLNLKSVTGLSLTPCTEFWIFQNFSQATLLYLWEKLFLPKLKTTWTTYPTFCWTLFWNILLHVLGRQLKKILIGNHACAIFHRQTTPSLSRESAPLEPWPLHQRAQEFFRKYLCEFYKILMRKT